MAIRGLNYIVRIFKRGNVMVTGLRGRGKDLIFGNVIARRKEPYVSNLDYGGEYIPFDYKNINLGGNTYDTMLHQPIFYEYPHPLGSDIYLSDVGVYFPAQYCNELNKKYQSIPYFMALSRQVAHCNFHCNCQSLSRIWDKYREQSDIVISAQRCFYIPKINLVIQKVYIYDKFQSAIDRVKPSRILYPHPMDISEKAENKRLYLDKFENTYGNIQSVWLIYFNKSNHDTYYFEKLLKNGVIKYEK